MLRKNNINGSHVTSVALYIKISVRFYYKNLKFQLFDGAFLFLLSIHLFFMYVCVCEYRRKERSARRLYNAVRKSLLIPTETG